MYLTCLSDSYRVRSGDHVGEFRVQTEQQNFRVDKSRVAVLQHDRLPIRAIVGRTPVYVVDPQVEPVQHLQSVD